MSNWKNDPKLLSEFYAQAARMVLDLPLLPNDQTVIYDDRVLFAVQQWGKADEFDTPEHAAGNFANWWRTEGLKVSVEPGITEIKVSIQPTIGHVPVRLEATINLDLVVEGDVQRALQSAVNLLCLQWRIGRDTIADNIRRAGMQAEPQGNQPSQTVSAPTSEETISITRLSKNYYNGNVSIRAHGGRWDKYGVPVYSEVLQQVGINADLISPQTPMVFNRSAVIQLENGKPKKVARFLG